MSRMSVRATTVPEGATDRPSWRIVKMLLAILAADAMCYYFAMRHGG